jgi:hypothetical protein
MIDSLSYLDKINNKFEWEEPFCLSQSPRNESINTSTARSESSLAKCRVSSVPILGWRKHMEDALLFHRINKDTFLFAVFDGHGGVEVSQFCAKKLPLVLESNPHFKTGNYAKALE